MKITENGFYTLNSPVRGGFGATSIVFISGDAGGSTLTFGYYNDYGTFIAFTDGIVTNPSQTTIKHGVEVRPVLNITGGSAIALSVVVTGHG